MAVNTYDTLIDAAGSQNNVDPRLIKTVLHLESSGGVNAGPSIPNDPDSPIGIMQMRPSTARAMGADPTKAEQAIFGATKYLREGLDATGSPQGALAYYHGGPDRSGWGPKTMAYVARGEGMYPSMTVPQRQQAAPAKPAAAEPDGNAILQKLLGGDVPAASGAPAPAGEADGQALLDAFLARAPAGTPAPPPDVARDPMLGTPLSNPAEAAPQAPAPPKNVAGLPVPGYPGQVSTGAPAPEKPGILAHVGGAIGSAFQGPYGPSDETMGDLVNGPNPTMNLVNRLIVGGGGTILDAAGRPLMALARGAGALASEGYQALGGSSGMGNRLERDVAQAPEALLPLTAPGASGVPRVAEAPAASPYPAIANKLQTAIANDVQGPARGQYLLNRLTGAINEADALPAETAPPGPSAGMGAPATSAGTAAPVPQSVGAAASRDMATAPPPPKTRAQEATDLRTSVTQTAADRAGPQGEDHNVYVPGVERPLAARVFTPENAVNEKVLRETDPAYDANYKRIEKNNNDVMKDAYLEHAGDANAIEAAKTAREAFTPDAMKVFDQQKLVDAGNVVSTIDDILGGAAGKRSAVTSTLADVRAKLFDKDGNLETAPDMLYGALHNLKDKLDTKGTDTASDNARAARYELMQVKKVLEAKITEGAPRFSEYMKAYSDASKPIDQMQFLQDHLTGAGKITDAQGNLQLTKVQKLLEKIDKERGKDSISKAQSLTEDQIQTIVAIRNELAAFSRRDELARTRGSDTTQKTNQTGVLGSGPLGTAVKGAADVAVHGGLAAATGGVGNLIYQYGYKPAMQAHKLNKQAEVTGALKSKLLDTQPNRLRGD